MKKQLLAIINLSLAQVEDRYRNGLIGQATFEAYCRVWDWSAVRWSGQADRKQEAFWKRYGKEAFYAKINKTRQAFGFPPVIA